jgi:hypothetical protein
MRKLKRTKREVKNDKIKNTLNRNTILAGNTKQKYGGSSAIKQC